MGSRRDGGDPPRLAAWLLSKLLPGSDSFFVCDDVAERYRREILPASGPFRARVWYWAEVIRSIGPAIRLRRRRSGAWRSEVRVAMRTLMRRPAWSVAAVGTLVLGIGGTTVIFGAVRSLLLRPMPFGDESRIVAFSSSGDWSGPEFLALREWRGPFEAVAAGTQVDWTFRTGDVAAGLVSGLQSTSELFDVLGAEAARGRSFDRGDDVPGAEPVVVLSHGMWRQELAGDPGIVGRSIVLDGVSRTVVGVMPEGFYFPTPTTRFWAPLPMAPDLWDYGLLGLVGRLSAGVSLDAASGALPVLGERLRERFNYSSGWDRTQTLGITPIRTFLVGDAARPLSLLLGAVALLLLIACANVSALVLGRALDRRGEVAVRAALGAGRGRLAVQAFVESLVLALPGGVLGAIAGAAGFRALRGWLPVDEAWRSTLTMDGWLIVAAFGVALFAATLVGLVAVHGVLRGQLEATLRSAGRRPRSTGGRALPLLVVGEVALTIVLVASAGALIRSIGKLNDRDVGIDPTGVVAIDVVVGAGDFDAVGRHDAFARILDRVRALPGVEQAALTQRLPLRDGGWQGPVRAEDGADDGNGSPSGFWRHVTPGYFEVLGMPIRSGRSFADTDDERAPGVVIVNQSLASTLWPGVSPLGRRMRTGMTPANEWLTVVGVVDDVPMTGLRDELGPVVYIPWAQAGVTMEGNTIVLRSAIGPALAGPAARSEIGRTDGRIAVARTVSMGAVVRQSIAQPRQLMLFLNLFGGLALVLGAVGVFGVLANFVRARMFEFGVRLALGSSPREVVGLVLGRASTLIGAGVAVGVVLSLMVSHLYQAFLFEMTANDPVTLAAAAAVLTITGGVAAFLPCRRAARADPISVLRAD